MEDVLGLRTTEMIVLDNGEEAGVWVTTCNKTYDVAFTADHYGAPAGSTMSPTPSTPVKTCSAPRISSSRLASTSKPVPTSTLSNRRSFST